MTGKFSNCQSEIQIEVYDIKVGEIWNSDSTAPPVDRRGSLSFCEGWGGSIVKS